jgi:protease-4
MTRTLLLAGTLLFISITPSAAQETLPYYPGTSDIVATVPSADEGALGATFNPAQWGAMPRGGFDFWWSDRGVTQGSLENWGFAFGRNVGFSVRRHDFEDALGVRHVTDYQLGAGGGSDAAFAGIAYGWSSGNDEDLGREDFLALGSIWRPTAWLSTGSVARLALGQPANEAIFDVAVRPLGTSALQLFTDYAVHRGQQWDEGELAGGVAVRPLRGLHASAKLAEGGNFQVSLGVTLQRLGTHAISHYDGDSERQATNYLIRGTPPHAGLDLEPLARGRARFVQFDLKGRAAYQTVRWGGGGVIPLRRLIEQLRFVADDPAADGVAVSLSGLVANSEMIWEIRRALESVRARGKRVVVYADAMNLDTYYLATAADRIVLDPEGSLLIPGLVRSQTFYKELLAKIGVGFDEWRFFRYKSAYERFSRDEMSEADRQQRQELLDGFYDEYARAIAAARGLRRSTLDSLRDARPYLTARRLRELGLVDELGRWEDIAAAAQRAGGRRARTESYARFHARREPVDEEWGPLPVIAVVYAVGECAMDTGIRARATSRAMRRFRKDRDVKALVLRADSPGGDPLASDLLAGELRALRAAEKPALVSQGRVAASGGYWISMEGDSIFASPFTVTGSIGVIGGWAWNEGLGDKLGLDADRVQVGRSADLLGGLTLPLLGVTLPERNLDERERGVIRETMFEMYGDFTRGVAQARDLDTAYVRSIAEGRVYTGRAAIEQRLVDQIGSLDETIEAAKRAAGIKPGRRVRIEEYPDPPLFRWPRLLPALPGIFGGEGDQEPTVLDPWLRSWEGRTVPFLLRNTGRPLVLMPPELLPAEEAAR